MGSVYQDKLNNEILDQVEKSRSSNNKLWMGLVRIAIKTDEGKELLKDIQENDKQISKLMGELG